MKQFRWLPLAVLLLAAPAYPESQAPVGQPYEVTRAGNPSVIIKYLPNVKATGTMRPDSTADVLRVDINGSLYTLNANDPRAALLSENVLSSKTLAVGAADSCAPITSLGYRHLKLLIKITPAAGNPGVTRLAIQVRTHRGGLNDSTNTFAEYPFADMALFRTAPIIPRGLTQSYSQDTSRTVVDTLNVGHLFVGSATVPWSGEFVVSGALNRNAPGNSSAAIAWSYPNGISIPLDNVFGRDFWASSISIRIRNMVGPTCVVTAWLEGTPL